jgi:methanogenic corrinoid protein MtbC1
MHMAPTAAVDEGEQLLEAALAGDFRAARAVAEAARSRGARHLYEDVVAVAMHRLGDRWAAGEVTVAEEHVASAVVASVLASFYPEVPWPVGGPRCVVAAVSGERHELGARMVGDLLALDGWDVSYAGADVPGDALVELVARERPVFVGLSVTLPSHLAPARATVARLRERVPGVRIVVGGRAVEASREDLGADLVVPTASAGVAAVRAWKG